MEAQIEQAFAVICQSHSPMVAIDFLDLCPIQFISQDLFDDIENGVYKAFSAHLKHFSRLEKLEIKTSLRNDQGNLSLSSIIAMTSDRVQRTPFKYLINSQLLQEWTHLITEKTPITPEFELILEHFKKNSLNMAAYVGQCLHKEAWSKALYILKNMNFVDLKSDLFYLLPMITRNKEVLFNDEILKERKNNGSDYFLTHDDLSDMVNPEPQTTLGKIYSSLLPGRFTAKIGIALRDAELKKTQERHELELKKVQEFRGLQAQYQKYSASSESKIQKDIFSPHECVDTVVKLALLDSVGESRKSAKQMAQQFSLELKSWYSENKQNENHLIFIMLETLALLGEYGGERLPQKKHHPELKRIPIKVYFDSPKKNFNYNENFFLCGSIW